MRVYRLLKGTSRALVVLAAVLILVAHVVITGFAVRRSPTLGFLTLLSVVPALLLAGYIWYGDPTLPQSLRSLVLTFLLGVLLAGSAGVVNSLLGALFDPIPGCLREPKYRDRRPP